MAAMARWRARLPSEPRCWRCRLPATWPRTPPGWDGRAAALCLPNRFLGARTLRWAVQRLLERPSYRARAASIARWSRENDGAHRAASIVEAFAATAGTKAGNAATLDLRAGVLRQGQGKS